MSVRSILLGAWPQGARRPIACALLLWLAMLVPSPAAAQSPEVPDIRGMILIEADRRLGERGLRLGQVDYRIADHQPGTIFEQRPAPGQPGGADGMVAVVVAEAPLVPDLRGHTLDRARALLRERSLRLGRVTRELSAEPSGTIIGQRPGPTQRSRFGAAIDVRVAEAPSVPNLVGRRADQATVLVQRQLLELREVEQRFSREPPGTILEQSPAPGAAAAAGDVVEVVTARALRVPDVTGRSRDEAAAALAASSLEVGEVSEAVADAAPGTVIGQDPAAGELALPGEAVSLRLARAPEVPDLSGLRRSAAAAELARSGLALGEVGYEAALEPPLTVLRQEPAAGTTAAAGATVDVVLATTPPTPVRPELVAVPELAGDRITAAEAEVKAAGLIPEVDNPPADNDVPGVVAEQEPPPGTLLPVGSVVRLGAQWVERVSLPQLEGLQLAEAEPLLQQRLLEPGEIAYLPARAEPGTIVGQRPPAGGAVEPGARIELIVARPPRAPSLLGMSAERAQPVLASELLRLGVVENVLAVDWPGTIVEQVPPPGTELVPDGVVHVKVASPVVPLTVGGSFLLALLTIASIAIRRTRRRAPQPVLRAETLRVVVGPDPGLQEAIGLARPLAGPRLSLSAHADAGRQSLEVLPEGDVDGPVLPDR